MLAQEPQLRGITGSGWFVFFFSGLCLGESLDALEAGVARDAANHAVYDRDVFRRDLVFLAWGNFDGAVHPDLGVIRVGYDTLTHPESYRLSNRWAISCKYGAAEFWLAHG